MSLWDKRGNSVISADHSLLTTDHSLLVFPKHFAERIGNLAEGAFVFDGFDDGGHDVFAAAGFVVEPLQDGIAATGVAAGAEGLEFGGLQLADAVVYSKNRGGVAVCRLEFIDAHDDFFPAFHLFLVLVGAA